MDRRTFAVGAVLASLAPGLRGAHAQSQGPIKIVVGFPPGPFGFDYVARQLAERLPEQLHRQVIVENRPGAAGRIALELVRAAKPDGDTLILSSQSPMTIAPYIYNNLRFDPVKDFTPVSRLTTFDYAVTVGPAAPVKTIDEFIDWLKRNPSKAMFATPGNGTTPHFIGEAFHQRIKVPAVSVAYKGGAPAVADLLAGQVPVQYDTIGNVEYHRSGRLRILATLGAKRNPLVPDVPTLKESGIDLVIDGWCGLYAPAGLSPELQAAYSKAVASVLSTESMRENLLKSGMLPAPTTPQELAEFQRREFEMWGPVIKASGFKPES